jgi:hypothetical protein
MSYETLKNKKSLGIPSAASSLRIAAATSRHSRQSPPAASAGRFGGRLASSVAHVTDLDRVQLVFNNTIFVDITWQPHIGPCSLVMKASLFGVSCHGHKPTTQSPDKVPPPHGTRDRRNAKARTRCHALFAEKSQHPVYVAATTHLQPVDHVKALQHLAEDDVPAVEPRRRRRSDKELAAIRVPSSVCHREHAWAATRAGSQRLACLETGRLSGQLTLAANATGGLSIMLQTGPTATDRNVTIRHLSHLHVLHRFQWRLLHEAGTWGMRGTGGAPGAVGLLGMHNRTLVPN